MVNLLEVDPRSFGKYVGLVPVAILVEMLALYWNGTLVFCLFVAAWYVPYTVKLWKEAEENPVNTAYPPLDQSVRFQWALCLLVNTVFFLISLDPLLALMQIGHAAFMCAFYISDCISPPRKEAFQF